MTLNDRTLADMVRVFSCARLDIERTRWFNGRMNRTSPTVGPITRKNGVAGNYELHTVVTYPKRDNDAPGDQFHVAFSGSEYGAPVVLITEHGQTFVTDWKQHGETLNADWVRRFFA